MKPTKDARKPGGKRKLEIRTERVRELATAAMDEVVGGMAIKTGLCNATI